MGVVVVIGTFAWWRDEGYQGWSLRETGFFGRHTYAGGSDKAGHIYTPYLGVRILGQTYEWLEVDRTTAAVARFAQLEDLPVHVYRAEGEIHSTGPSDRLLTDAEIERLKGLGLIPIAAARGRDLASIGCFRSVTGEPLFSE